MPCLRRSSAGITSWPFEVNVALGSLMSYIIAEVSRNAPTWGLETSCRRVLPGSRTSWKLSSFGRQRGYVSLELIAVAGWYPTDAEDSCYQAGQTAADHLAAPRSGGYADVPKRKDRSSSGAERAQRR